MGRPAEATAPRERCTRGWQGQSCKKRTCPICGVVWAGDWRRVLFEALQMPEVPVALSAVTPPGAEGLPWDEGHCAHRGPHKHDGERGCRVDGDALSEWSRDISRRWKRLHNAARNACKRELGRCLPLAVRAWEPQKRGPGHVHPVFHLYSPADVTVAECYLRHVARIAPKHGFGFVGEKRGKSMQIMPGGRAAAYLSSYFVRGKGSKATLQDNARNPNLPRMLIWVSPTLTRPTGVTMRNLRRCRQLWAVRTGLLPPPSWSGVELARVVALTGPWPARGP
ncbi:MAG: hypothetical protein OEV29_12040 [Thermoleophilia bacterium]|nr:hypothetical protein [Thermoleophilia bacterium]